MNSDQPKARLHPFSNKLTTDERPIESTILTHDEYCIKKNKTEPNTATRPSNTPVVSEEEKHVANVEYLKGKYNMK